ncbi:unnamed protein product [Acanthosepion pharaonis]|uniref:TIR domain-containing protein n=1 Tax=Acanthosepion pharaonis TaxID=158019 RepID=A0A812D419_ACAPH|nr:unnamed protein product [Sepia pharaonis]
MAGGAVICDRRILGVQLVQGPSRSLCLGVLSVPAYMLSNHTTSNMRSLLQTQLHKHLPTNFTFRTCRGWPILPEQEKDVPIEEIVSSDCCIHIERYFGVPRIGVMNQMGEGLGYTLAEYTMSLSNLRDLLVSRRIISREVPFIFLTSNQWPVSIIQEKSLQVMDVLVDSYIRLQVCHSAQERIQQENSAEKMDTRRKRKFSEMSLNQMQPVDCEGESSRAKSLNYTNQGKQILLSYVRAESSQLASCLKAELLALNVSVFLDVDEIKSGVDWQDSLNEAVTKCEVFIPLLTPRYGQTRWTNREVKLADVLGKFILPINLQNEWPPSCLAIQLATTQYIDGFKISEACKSPHHSVQNLSPKPDGLPVNVKLIAKEIHKCLKSLNENRPHSLERKPSLFRRTSKINNCPMNAVQFQNFYGEGPSTYNQKTLIVVSLHQEQYAFGCQIKQWLQEDGFNIWLTTELDSNCNSQIGCQKFQEKADEAAAIIFVLSKAYTSSGRCLQQFLILRLFFYSLHCLFVLLHVLLSPLGPSACTVTSCSLGLCCHLSFLLLASFSLAMLSSFFLWGYTLLFPSLSLHVLFPSHFFLLSLSFSLFPSLSFLLTFSFALFLSHFFLLFLSLFFHLFLSLFFLLFLSLFFLLSLCSLFLSFSFSRCALSLSFSRCALSLSPSLSLAVLSLSLLLFLSLCSLSLSFSFSRCALSLSPSLSRCASLSLLLFLSFVLSLSPPLSLAVLSLSPSLSLAVLSFSFLLSPPSFFSRSFSLCALLFSSPPQPSFLPPSSLFMPSLPSPDVHQPNFQQLLVKWVREILDPKTQSSQDQSECNELEVKCIMQNLKQKVNLEKCIYITGTSAPDEATSNLCRSIGKHLASIVGIQLVTSGYYGVAQEICKGFLQKHSSNANSYASITHILPKIDCKKPKENGECSTLVPGQTLYFGSGRHQRDIIAAHAFERCILVEGEPDMASMTQHFVWNDNIVIPVSCYKNKDIFPEKIFEPPSGVEESDWLYVTQGEHEQDSVGLCLSHIVESLFNLSKEYSTPPVRASLNKFFSQTPQSLSLMREQDDSQMVSLSHQDTLVLSPDAFLP